MAEVAVAEVEGVEVAGGVFFAIFEAVFVGAGGVKMSVGGVEMEVVEELVEISLFFFPGSLGAGVEVVVVEGLEVGETAFTFEPFLKSWREISSSPSERMRMPWKNSRPESWFWRTRKDPY